MQSVEEKKAQYNVIIKTCYITAAIYLSVHILYMIFFLIVKADILLYINFFSIAFYLFSFYLIKKKKYFAYANLCGNEFFIFMSAATIIGGFQAGFHLCIIGLSIVSFFTTYFSFRKRNIKGAIIWCIISLAIYLTLHLYCSFNDPIIVFPKWLNVTLYSLHSVAAFTFVIAYLYIFLNYALKLENKILNESRTDELTQIPNRYEMYIYADSIEDKTNYALAIFDIDDFKKINDTYGHVNGDLILKEIAKIATNEATDSFVCRYGGEEFIVIIPTKGDINYAFNIMENIRMAIKDRKFLFDDEVVNVTISVGIEQYDNAISMDRWISLADNKLYESKAKGKNRITI